MSNDKTWNRLSRRDFIETGATAALALSLMPRARLFAKQSSGYPVHITALSPSADDAAVEKAVRRAALAATDFGWLKRGDMVIIKPVCNSGEPYPAVTRPAGLKAMARLLKEKGAGRVVVVDQAGVEHVRRCPERLEGSTRKLMKNNGLYQAATEGGAELFYPEEGPYEDYFAESIGPGGHWKNGFMLPNILKEADHVVLLPRVGSHAIAGVSLGYKAAVGWLRHDSRLELHRDAATFFEKVVEIHSSPTFTEKTRLTLSVADRVLSTYGPDKGHVTEPEPGLVLASDNLMAHDAAATAWYLWNYENETSALARLKDPRKLPATRINKYVVKTGWGKEEAKKAQDFPEVNIGKVPTDATLSAAAALQGGLPKIAWRPDTGKIPPGLPDELDKYMT